MIVCVCNAVSDRDIRKMADAGVSDFETLQAMTACSTCCGCCEGTARAVLAEALQVRREHSQPQVLDLPLVPAAA